MSKYHQILTKYAKIASTESEHTDVITWRADVESRKHIHIHVELCVWLKFVRQCSVFQPATSVGGWLE